MRDYYRKAKIHVLTGWVDAQGEEHVFSFQHMPILEQTLATYQPRLVIIDPIQSYLGSGVDMHRANETRPLLEALRRLAEAYECAIVCIRHPAKSSQGGKAIHRGLGSVDFIGAARTGLFVEQHPTEPGKVLLAQSKSNIGPLGRTQVFTKEQGHFEWCTVSRLSAEMLAGSGRGPEPYVFLEAVCWLEERLRDGLPVSAEEVRRDAEEDGISFPALRRAKKALGVRSLKRADAWDWQLLPLALIPLPVPLLSLVTRYPLGHLQDSQSVTQERRPQAGEDTSEEMRLPDVIAPEPASDVTHAEALTQPVEKREDVQEAHVGQAAQHPPASAPRGPRQAETPRFCPGCSRATTWLIRGETLVCYQCGTVIPHPDVTGC